MASMSLSSNNFVRQWAEKFSRSGYFFGALLLHLVVFIMVATWVIFPAFHPPVDDFKKTYLPPPPAPTQPPQVQQTVPVPTKSVTAPTSVISSTAPSPTFSVPLPDFSHSVSPDVENKLSTPVQTSVNTNLPQRLASLSATVKGWGRDLANVRESNSDPRNVKAKFPIFLAKYADPSGDNDWAWDATVRDGKIIMGSLVLLSAKINEWSHGAIASQVEPEPLDIGGPELMEKRPPFIFFSGHKDFVLSDQEIRNLRDYLQVGGAIWGDNALAGRGSRFDIAFRREMKRVLPDVDKNFEVLPMTHPIFTKSWNQITEVPSGMNYFQEPLEHIDIDGKLAILYTPNDYNDMMDMRILPGDKELYENYLAEPDVLNTNFGYLYTNTYYRNFDLEHCLAVQQLGMNIIGYLLVRFDDVLLLAPP